MRRLAKFVGQWPPKCPVCKPALHPLSYNGTNWCRLLIIDKVNQKFACKSGILEHYLLAKFVKSVRTYGCGMSLLLLHNLKLSATKSNEQIGVLWSDI